jgi:8-oxo-dGTP pyrophosphatase MutT (NUDIX family)
VKTNNEINNPYQLINILKTALEAPLPGITAHKRMSPPHRIHYPDQGVQIRTSAVLILIYPTPHGIFIPFTLRLKTLAHHGGEICLPGGGIEDCDTSLSHTALRESAEELGLDQTSVHILGALTPIYISTSQNMVHPIIGWTNSRPTFSPSPYEVERVIEVPIKTLLEPRNVRDCLLKNNGQTHTVPCYCINSDYIWGATAMILSEFLCIINTQILAIEH